MYVIVLHYSKIKIDWSIDWLIHDRGWIVKGGPRAGSVVSSALINNRPQEMVFKNPKLIL